jgi:ABC-type transporter MlaC component
MSAVKSSADRTVVWIVSYPKSGNTWVRFLVCNLVFGPQDSAAALNQLVPDIHELAAPPPPPNQPVLLKTHFPFTPALPLATSTAGAIYVVRDPADVMLSNFHYSQRSGAANSAALAQYLEQYLAARGDPRWITLQMGPWDEHVRSWLGGSAPFPVLALRYEDLLRDSLQAARQIAAFLGLARSAHQLQQAVAAASFARMREIEEADIHRKNVGIFYKPYLQTSIDAGLRFMRAGRAGEAARVLTPQQRQQIAAAFAPMMQELGYGDGTPAGATPAGTVPAGVDPQVAALPATLA